MVPNLSIKPRVPLSCLPQRTFLAWKISFVPIKSIAPNNHIENVAVPGLNPLLANLKQAVTDRLTTTGPFCSRHISVSRPSKYQTMVQ